MYYMWTWKHVQSHQQTWLLAQVNAVYTNWCLFLFFFISSFRCFSRIFFCFSACGRSALISCFITERSVDLMPIACKEGSVRGGGRQRDVRRMYNHRMNKIMYWCKRKWIQVMLMVYCFHNVMDVQHSMLGVSWLLYAHGYVTES